MIWAILAFLVFFSILVCRASKAFVRYAEQREYEQRRQMLLMIGELERLDKALKENEKIRNAQLIQPYKDLWQMRN